MLAIRDRELEKEIEKKIFKFDVQPLLYLLNKLGYTEDNIMFKSAYSTCSQPSLLAGIQFIEKPKPEVVIYVNWGILSPQTPLPSYIFKTIGDSFGGSKSFIDFVNFFDHHLFKSFIAASYPETYDISGVSWEDLKRSFLKLTGIKSVSSLHWLFQKIYPELDVNVKKTILKQDAYNDGLRLGYCKLGDPHSLGRSTSLPVNAFTITLYADGAYDYCMVPWPVEALKRFDRDVRQFLSNLNVNMELFLIIREQNTMARLSLESYLGYDKIRGDHLNKRRIKIFRGRIE